MLTLLQHERAWRSTLSSLDIGFKVTTTLRAIRVEIIKIVRQPSSCCFGSLKFTRAAVSKIECMKIRTWLAILTNLLSSDSTLQLIQKNKQYTVLVSSHPVMTSNETDTNTKLWSKCLNVQQWLIPSCKAMNYHIIHIATPKCAHINKKSLCQTERNIECRQCPTVISQKCVLMPNLTYGLLSTYDMNIFD